MLVFFNLAMKEITVLHLCVWAKCFSCLIYIRFIFSCSPKVQQLYQVILSLCGTFLPMDFQQVYKVARLWINVKHCMYKHIRQNQTCTAK